MKKIFSAILVLFIATMLVSCAEDDTATAETPTPVLVQMPEDYSQQEESEPTPPPNYELPEGVGMPTTFSGTASIGYASEEDMARYPDAPSFVFAPYGIWMMFSFEEPVSDVAFVGVSSYFDERFDFWLFEIGESWYEAGDLAAGQPVFIQTIGHFGTLPAQAIGFTYADGVRYYIPFDQSQMDGSLTLHKWSASTFDR